MRLPSGDQSAYPSQVPSVRAVGELPLLASGQVDDPQVGGSGQLVKRGRDRGPACDEDLVPVRRPRRLPVNQALVIGDPFDVRSVGVRDVELGVVQQVALVPRRNGAEAGEGNPLPVRGVGRGDVSTSPRGNLPLLGAVGVHGSDHSYVAAGFART